MATAGARLACTALLWGCAIAGAAAQPRAGNEQTVEDELPELNRAAHALERGDPAAALERADAIAALAGTRGDESELGRALLHRSHALRLLGRHGEALVSGEDARRHATSAEDEATLAAALANLGVLYEVAGLEAEALSLHRRALTLFERHGRHDAVASTLLNLGNLFETRGELTEATAAYERALQIKRERDLPGIGSALGNLALIAIRRGRHDEAIDLLDRSIEAQQHDGNALGLAFAWRNRSNALIELGRYGEAIDALDRAWALVDAPDLRLGQAAVAEGRAELYQRQAGEPPNRTLLELALASNAQALELAADAEPARRVRLLRQRADLGEAAGDPGLALAALREAETLVAHDRQLANDRRYAVLSAYFDSERQAARIQALQDRRAADIAELSRQRLLRNSLIAGALLIAAIAVLLLGRIRQRRNAERELASRNRSLAAALASAERARARAEETERLNRELLRVAAEDLRVPLTATLGSAERLLIVAGEQSTLRREAAGIADTLQHLVVVVNNLIESAELERTDAVLARRPLDLATVLRSVCEHYSLRASEKRQSLQCHAPEALPMQGDADRLREALEHLVGNALKFTPPGRPIDVTLDTEPVRGTADGIAVVRVRDRGPGLREQDRERLFGKLQRLSARPTGSEHSAGLGLWLVKRIAELHGGSIEATPAADGEGSVFTLRLPLPV